ncbi:hypothetical protein BC332_31442 [Capsicum chinense]|nr:hypothetical protein BC332_31442 [Capsicum chinense]
MSFSEKHLDDLSKRIEQVSEENQNLRQKLTQLQAEYRVNQDNRDYVRENYQEKVKELKSETLLTTVLREKLYSKEMDIKQLQADLAATIRGNNILKREVQNALDALCCATPNLNYLELQDENINQLTNDLQECMKELGIVKGILPKVFQERDFMWEEVKSYSEMNMLLNYEINILKKKGERHNAKELGNRNHIEAVSCYMPVGNTGNKDKHKQRVQNAQTRQLSHPLPVLRAREIDEWSRSQDYRSLLQRAIQVLYIFSLKFQIRAEELLLKVGRAFTLARSVLLLQAKQDGI